LDLRAYFDNVQHYLLLEKVARRIQDDAVMHLLKMILKATGKKGVPQGGVISPLLSKSWLQIAFSAGSTLFYRIVTLNSIPPAYPRNFFDGLSAIGTSSEILPFTENTVSAPMFIQVNAPAGSVGFRYPRPAGCPVAAAEVHDACESPMQTTPPSICTSTGA
jgi:hypothetical protein